MTEAASIALAVAAATAELRRQGEARGIDVECNGELAQIDGSFVLEPLVRAVLASIQRPSEGMLDAARGEAWAAGTSIRTHEIEGIYGAMIEELLGARR